MCCKFSGKNGKRHNKEIYHALIAVALNAFVESDRSNGAVTIKMLQLTSQTERGAFCNAHVVGVLVMPILKQIYKQNKGSFLLVNGFANNMLGVAIGRNFVLRRVLAQKSSCE